MQLTKIRHIQQHFLYYSIKNTSSNFATIMQTNVTCQHVQSEFSLRSNSVCAVLLYDFQMLI